jgi:hypothetical protein
VKDVRSWRFRGTHHWMLWWFDAGLVIAAVALANLPFLNLTHPQEKAIFILCVLHWLLAGLACWAFEGIRDNAEIQPLTPRQPGAVPQDREWHSASEFRLPGSGETLLPLPVGRHTRETLAHYRFHHHA